MPPTLPVRSELAADRAVERRTLHPDGRDDERYSAYRRECPPDRVVSFMAECIDGIEACRAARGKEAEDDADGG